MSSYLRVTACTGIFWLHSRFWKMTHPSQERCHGSIFGRVLFLDGRYASSQIAEMNILYMDSFNCKLTQPKTPWEDTLGERLSRSGSLWRIIVIVLTEVAVAGWLSCISVLNISHCASDDFLLFSQWTMKTGLYHQQTFNDILVHHSLSQQNLKLNASHASS